MPAPPLDRQAPSAVAAAWLLCLGLLASGLLVGLLLLRPIFGLPSWWYALPVVAPYFLLAVAAVLARRQTPVLAAAVACLALGCAAGLLVAFAFGFDEAWQRSISGYRDSGSGAQAGIWLQVAILQGGLALLADRLLARSVRIGERLLGYFVSSIVLCAVVAAGLGRIEERRRAARIAPPEAVAANRETLSDERAAAAAMLWIHGAAQRYRLAHRDAGYPASLADLARGEATAEGAPPPSVRSVLATGVGSGYRIQFRALPGGGGPVAAYQLTASPLPRTPSSPRAAGFVEASRYYFSDQTGVLHGAPGAADADSPVENGLAASIGSALGQAQLQLDNDWAAKGSFPAEMENAVRSAARAGYLLTYRAEGSAPGVLDRFRLEARPLRYGETGVRSYYLDETGAVHATPEPRAASPDDPVADECELAEVGKSCRPQAELAAGERWPRAHAGVRALPQAPEPPAAPPPGESIAGTADDGTVIVVDSSSRLLSAIDPVGQVLWQLRGAQEPVLVGSDRVHVSAADVVRAISTRGQVLWYVRLPWGGAPRAMALAKSGSLVLLTNSTLQAIAPGGRETWRRRPPVRVTNGDRVGVRIDGGELRVQVQDKTFRYSLADGRELAP